MQLFDTHAHLDFPFLHERLDEVLEEAKNNHVTRIVTIGASRGLQSNYNALAIAKQHDHIRCTAGIHPHDASMATPEVIETIRTELSTHEQVVGIGETGLDYHYNKAPHDVQQNVFRAFLRMSKECNKPVIIHSRDAEEDTLKLLKEEGVTGGILHCFTGSAGFAQQLLELDFYISFSGIVTFKSAKDILEVATTVPRDRLLVETDSPYLAPVPFRGKKNQPAYVFHTAQHIADARQETLEELASYSFKNAQTVFHWE